MRALVVAIVVAFGLPALPVHADAIEDAALEHLDRGIAAFEAKDFHLAHREFTRAHDLVPDRANPFRWLALAEIQLGDCGAAVPHIAAFLARVPKTDPRAAEMTRWRDFCARKPVSPAPHMPGGAGTPPGTATGTQVTGTRDLGATPPPPAARTPLHERWWFWPLVGTAAVAVTGAIVYTATDGDASTLPPVRCDNTGCR